MQKKRFISMLLAGALTISLAACGNSSNGGEGNGNTPNTSGKAVEAEPKGTEDSAGKSVTYWIDPEMGGITNASTFDDAPCWQAIQENTGIDVVWEHPASGQSQEQFNLIVASSELPDIMYYSWGTAYPGGPDAAIADGKIYALNDYIKEYAPNLTAYLERHPDMEKAITTDEGNIYCFPGIYTSTSDSSDVWQTAIDREPFYEPFIGLVIRKDWLDDLGLDIPVTLDDWYNTLKAFRDEKGAKYPLSYMNMFGCMAQSFATAFDITLPVTAMGGATAFGIREDGTIQYGPAQEGYRGYLEFMNKLYSEGLLDPDFIVQDRTTLQSKVVNGEVGAWIEMMPAGLGTLRTQVLAEDPEASFYPVGVANPVREEEQKLYYFQANYPYVNSGAAITTSCKDIEMAVKLLDYCWSEEGERLVNWGIEGESYEMVDGWPQFTDQIIHNDLGLSPSQAHAQYRQLNGPFPMDHWQRLVSKTDYTLEEGKVDENIASLDLWAKNGTQPAGLPSTTILSSESGDYASKFNEINTYADEMYSKFIMGQESLDNFDKYVENLKKMGLDDVIAIQESALERYNNRTAG